MHQTSTLLTGAQIESVHQASLEILEQVGLDVHNETARELFKKSGCNVDPPSLRVKFPAKVIEEFRSMIPSKFIFRGRDPIYDRTLPDDGPIFLTSSSAPNVIDPATGEQRWARSDDIALIAHLVNALPGIDVFSVSALADDGPFEYSTGVSRFYPAMKNCAKPIRGSGPPKDVPQILELCHLIAGSKEAYLEHPFFMHHHCPVISPLTMDDDSTEVLMYYTREGLPNYPTLVPIAGLNSPMTLVGTLAQGNAEFLAAAVLMQMVRPGTPLLYSSLPTVADMRSGAYAPGGIECGILNMVSAQMAQYYNLPYSFYFATNSKLCDAQAGYERGVLLMTAMLCGASVIQFVGLIDALMAFDYSMAAIDNELAMMVKRFLHGFEFGEQNPALEVIRAVREDGKSNSAPPAGNRLDSVPPLSEIADRNPRSVWLEKGATTAADRALLRAHEILTHDNPAVFSPEVDRRIRDHFTGIVAGDAPPPPPWLPSIGKP